MCCRERELCEFVHDRFIFETDSVQLTCIESRLKENENFERRTDTDIDDDDDKLITIMNRTEFWMHLSESCDQITVQSRKLITRNES